MFRMFVQHTSHVFKKEAGGVYEFSHQHICFGQFWVDVFLLDLKFQWWAAFLFVPNMCLGLHLKLLAKIIDVGGCILT